MPPSTLNYWVQIGLVTPSLQKPDGNRVEQWWSLNDVVIVRALRTLRGFGVSLQALRKIQKRLNLWGHSFADSQLIWQGEDVLLLGPEGTVESVVIAPGQRVFLVGGLPVAAWHEQARRLAEPVELSELHRKARLRKQVRQRRREAMQAVVIETAVEPS